MAKSKTGTLAPAAPPQQELIVPKEQLVTPPSELAGAPLSAAAQAFMDEVKGERQLPNKVPIVKIDHKAGVFLLPSAEEVPQISGYPVHYFQTRSYYKKPPPPGGSADPPDCWSPDLLAPSPASIHKQSETCWECPQAQFTTGRDGKSQACATYTWVFLLNPAYGTPPLVAVRFPPSSIRALLGGRMSGGYFSQAAARHGVYEIVWTTLRLVRAGEIHCVVEPHMGPACADVARVKEIVAIRNKFLDLFGALRGLPPQQTGPAEVE